LPVHHVDALPQVAADLRISLAILSVPAECAQRVAEQIVAGGIVGLLNFAPTPLVVPPSVNVVDVDLSVQLEHLAYKVLNTRAAAFPAPDSLSERPAAC
jgi:redox-sensing transcriptional repressor